VHDELGAPGGAGGRWSLKGVNLRGMEFVFFFFFFFFFLCLWEDREKVARWAGGGVCSSPFSFSWDTYIHIQVAKKRSGGELF
jgi:hypothetical protein